MYHPSQSLPFHIYSAMILTAPHSGSFNIKLCNLLLVNFARTNHAVIKQFKNYLIAQKTLNRHER